MSLAAGGMVSCALHGTSVCMEVCIVCRTNGKLSQSGPSESNPRGKEVLAGVEKAAGAGAVFGCLTSYVFCSGGQEKLIISAVLDNHRYAFPQ